MSSCRDFRERLKNGETIICAAGCTSELEHRGFIEINHVTPEAALEHRDAVKLIHEDFVHCGSDVVVACNHHGLGPPSQSDNDMAYIRQFLKIARAVADKSKTMMAGNINPTGIYDPKDHNNMLTRAKKLLTTQIKMAVEEKADFLLGDTFLYLEESKLALECIKEHGNGLPVVMMLSMLKQRKTHDGVSLPEALRELEKLGADVVGLSCGACPSIVLAELKEARKICKGPLAALPIAYRSNARDYFPNALMNLALDPETTPCNRKDIQQFAQMCEDEKIQFVGLCCGGSPSYFREIADTHGRQTPASKFCPKLSVCNVFLANPTPCQAKRRIFQIAQEYRKFYGIHSILLH